MLGAMIVTFVLLLLFLVQVYVSANQNYRLLHLASSSAKRIVDAKWWLGMQDPDYVVPIEGTNGSDATTVSAREELDAELKAMGLGKSKNFRVSLKKIWLQKKVTTIVRVEFDVDIAMSIFKYVVKFHPTGVASDAEHAVTAHGYTLLHVVDGPNERGLRIPVYNVTIGQNTNADTSSSLDNKWFRAGNFTGPVPTAYLRLECPSNGSLLKRPHLSKETGKVDYVEVRPWGPYGGVQPHNEGPGQNQ